MKSEPMITRLKETEREKELKGKSPEDDSLSPGNLSRELDSLQDCHQQGKSKEIKKSKKKRNKHKKAKKYELRKALYFRKNQQTQNLKLALLASIVRCRLQSLRIGRLGGIQFPLFPITLCNTMAWNSTVEANNTGSCTRSR